MARKNLLKGLMEAGAEAPSPTPASPPNTPRYSKGAIGAVSQSIAELKSRSVSEIDVSLIDMAGNVDRLGEDDEDHKALVNSIREYGQQVPVLLRPNPENPERFQVVYGRRRLRALQELGQPAKALIRDLDDKALVIAQGQENSARRDLTFIERANFARQMRDAGYDRKVIGDALHVDKTVISRMLTVADALPVPLIEAIGPAPSVGRDRWLALTAQIEAMSLSEADALDILATLPDATPSDDRFAALFAQLAAPAKAAAKAEKKITTRTSLKDETGTEFAQVTRSGGKMVLTIKPEAGSGFDRWLLKNLTAIHRDWKAQSGE